MRRLDRLGAGVALLSLAALCGCYDGFASPGHWDVTQANQLNLAAQATDWRDLVLGHGDPGSDGQEAAAAVDRLRRGTVKPLPAATVSDIASQGIAAPPATANAAGGT